ncbi:MAG TPA: histidinol dehydrogenase [Firmicutes bacterium]|nr:histidinol dehydrogenase [Bacillota bacterium]
MKKVDFEFLKRKRFEKDGIEKKVRDIIEKVKKEGDKALFYFTEKFDGVRLNQLKVKNSEISSAKKFLSPEILKIIKETSKRIERYHKKQLPSKFSIKENDITLEFLFSPIEKVGIYIPAGQSPLLSTILMTVIPAKIAGVKKIFIASPPSYDGKVHPLILATCNFLGINDIFSIGGAQAISAFAFGTETVPKVDLIAGPGNEYVNTAKRLVYGEVGVDLPAGPSEIVIFSDKSGNDKFIEMDLKSQMEHKGGLGIFITTSERLGEKISKRVKEGYWILVRNSDEAVEIINFIKPEHLQIICRNPEKILNRVIAGAIFVGNYSPATIGDYFAGPSHVLPTGKTAGFSSGLSVYTFLRSYAVIEAKKEFFDKYGEIIKKFAEIEGLKMHSESISIRMEKNHLHKTS